MLSFAKRFFITAAIVVAITDLVVFYVHYGLSLPLVLATAFITMVPIAIGMWYWLPKYGMKW